MKNFKIIDIWVSVILLLSFTIFSLIKLDYTFLIGYCVVGAWQMISMVVHTLKGWFIHRRAGRYHYELAVALIASFTLLGLLFYPLLFFVMIVMLFAAPFMAVYYTWLCYNEVYVKMQRPMAALK